MQGPDVEIHGRLEMLKDDYLVKMSNQLTQFLTKISKQKEANEHDQALDTVAEALFAIFGKELDVMEQLDPASAARMLGSRGRRDIYLRLVREEAGLYEKLGQRVLADKLTQKARDLEAVELPQ